MKKFISRLLILAVVAAAGYGAWRLFQGLPSRQVQTPTTKARQGDVIVRSYARGELRAVRSATLTAPNLFGTVQVTRLAPLGAFSREKDLIVEFDDSEVLARLEQKQLELEQVDEQIKKAQADLNIRNNQDQVELLRARYSVRRAELEVKRNELLSAIDQQKNTLNLEEARRRLKQLESDVKSRQEQAQAELAVLRERRNRNVLDINRERMRLAQVKLLSPISGLVAIKQNRSGFSGMFGSAVPDIREGDQVQPGIPVAEVLDLSELEVVARVGELDRANLTEGQDVLIRLDAIADKVFNGKIKSMSGTASANVFSADPGKKFDVVFSIDMKQLLTTLGATPDQVARIMATAEANRKRPIASGPTGMFGGLPEVAMAMMAGGAGGNAGGARTFMMGGAPGGMAGGAPGGMPQLSAEQQTQMREAFQKALGGRNMQDLSQEERQKIFAQLRSTMQGAATKGATTKGATTKGAATKATATKGGEATKAGEQQAQAQPGERRRGLRAEGQAGAEAGQQQGQRGQRGGDPGDVLAQRPVTNAQGYSQQDLENAKIPSPPSADSDLEVLLRPGLLADVEIIVEKVPDAIYVPNQAVFEREGKPVVFVRTQKGAFEQRAIKIAKRSETVTVIAEGIGAGDVIAMADPTVSPEDRKKAATQKSTGGPMGAMPGGASKGGQ
jgi:HlyD family secretion protein